MMIIIIFSLSFLCTYGMHNMYALYLKITITVLAAWHSLVYPKAQYPLSKPMSVLKRIVTSFAMCLYQNDFWCDHLRLGSVCIDPYWWIHLWWDFRQPFSTASHIGHRYSAARVNPWKWKWARRCHLGTLQTIHAVVDLYVCYYSYFSHWCWLLLLVW